MRIIHLSETEFTTLPDSMSVRVKLNGTDMHVITSIGTHCAGVNPFSGTREERESIAKQEYSRFMEWLRCGESGSEFRFVLKTS